MLKKILRNEEGADMIEYGLIGAFISIVAAATIKLIGPLVAALYTTIKDALS